MGEISERLEALVAARRDRLAEVDAEIAAWTAVATALARLENSLAIPWETPVDDFPPVRGEPAGVAGADLARRFRRLVSETLEDLAAARSRFARDTINIGASGRARVGKSSLLQSISGLTDDQIPTGPDVPVTAVRSRIVHSSRRRALLRMHTAETFLADVVAPYHAELGLAGVPRTLEEFKDWEYPRPDPADPDRHSSNALLLRLLRMQASLDSYAGGLHGKEVERDLAGLRPYVAYPTGEEDAAGTTYRPHLAVREVMIECPFRHDDVTRLAIVDLRVPGEVAAGAEERHVRDLRHDVDVVLLVVRPSSTEAYFGDSDKRALELLDRARGHVHRPGHYVHFVINHGGEPESRIRALRQDLATQVNAGTDGGFYPVFETDAVDAATVGRTLLVPLLDMLSRTLPVMDQEVFAGVMDRVAATAREVGGALPGILAGQVDPAELAHLEQELLAQRADELRGEVDESLRATVGELWRAAHREGMDERYADAVEAVFTGIREWVADGFGLGAERWRREASRVILTGRNASPFIVEEMHRVRVEVSRRFRALDAFFDEHLARTWGDIAEAFGGTCGPLLGGEPPGAGALRSLEGHLRAASCRVLADAVHDLLRTRLDYRTHLHPRVREELDAFNFEGVDRETGRPRVALLVSPDDAGVEMLEQQLRERTHKAAFETMAALQREAVLPALVLYAAVKQFEDEFILSGDSRREFLRLARSRRDVLWPRDFERLGAATARAGAVADLVRTVRDVLSRRGGTGTGAGAGGNTGGGNTGSAGAGAGAGSRGAGGGGSRDGRGDGENDEGARA